MRKTIAFLALSTLLWLLAGSRVQMGLRAANPQIGQSAAEMAFQFQPGQYRTATKIDKITSRMPAAALNRPKAMGKPIELEYCMSPEKAATGAEADSEHGKANASFVRGQGGTMDSVIIW
jgi:hypothetical protein